MRFNSLKDAIEKYEEMKRMFFSESANEHIFESNERQISDNANELKLEFVNAEVSESIFNQLHSASIADLNL